MKTRTPVIARYSLSLIYFGKATSELFGTNGLVMNNLTTCLCGDCFVPYNDVLVGRDAMHCVSTTRFAFCTILLCLFLTVNALAQSNNTTKKDTSIYQLLQDIKKKPGTSDPLILLNDSIYEGDMHSIKSKEIESVDVIKGSDAKAIYGEKAQNGAFMMKTRKYIADRNYHGSDVMEPKLVDSIIFIVDGVPVNREQINPGDILFRDVLAGRQLDFIHSNKKLDSVFVIITKQGAIKSYQKKFSAFSEKYKDYLKSHQNKDDDFLYVLDGVQVRGKQNEIINTLYKIQPEKIKEVGFNVKEPTDGSKNLVIINTKR